MQALVVTHSGEAASLQFCELPIPQPGAEQLLIRVRATGINRADILQRRGLYPPPPGVSPILGLEIAGEVVACGERVERFQPGQRIFGLTAAGGYAQYCLIDQYLAMATPTHWSDTYAAAIPENFITAHQTLFKLGQLQAAETVLIHAGGSGVGTASIQMACYQGAKVYVTAGSAEKVTKAQALGAMAGINYKSQDFVTEIQQLTAGLGVDVIQDFLGASYFSRNLSLLKFGGRLIQIALMGGRRCEIDLGLVLRNYLQIKGSVLRTQPLAVKRSLVDEFQRDWLPVLSVGEIQPVIAAIYSWHKVQAAHRFMEDNLNFGKIILTID